MSARQSRPDGAPEVGVEPEPELHARRFWEAIVSRWWLLLLGVVLGAIVGYLVSLGGETVYEARATVYLGQPLAPTGTSQIQGLQTNPSSVNQIVRSRSVIASVASETGISPDLLRRGISTRTVASTSTRTGQTPLVEVAVRGPWRRESADAANLLAEAAIGSTSDYVEAKIQQLIALRDAQDRQLAALEGTIADYNSAIEAGNELTPTEQLVLLGLLDNAERERASVIQQRAQTALSLSLAEEVELGQIVTRAATAKLEARSRRTSIVVGAVIGLVAGLVVALAWDPARRIIRQEARR